MSQHTPVPWRVEDYVASDGVRILGRQIVGADGSVVARWTTNPTAESNANQAAICRAVNSHEEMIDALRHCLLIAEVREHPAVSALVRAALAKAKAHP